MSHAADRPLSVRVSPVQRAPAQVRSSARCERRHHQHPPASAGMPEWLFDLLRRIAAKRTVFNILSRSRLCSTPARIRMSASDRRRVDRPTRCVAPGDLVPGSGHLLRGPGLIGDRSVRSAVRQRPYGSNQLPDLRRTRSSISRQAQRRPLQGHTAEIICGRLCSCAHGAAR